MVVGLGLAILTLDESSKATRPRRNSVSAGANSSLSKRLFKIGHMVILAALAGLGILQGVIFMYGLVFNPQVCDQEKQLYIWF